MKGLIIAVVIGALILSGCATIIHGKTQSVTITSDPPGAMATVGGQTVKTPSEVTLRRDKNYTVMVEKDGFQTGQTTVEKSVDPIILGNIIFGGLIGLAIDFGSGSAYKLSPEKVNLALRPTGPTAGTVGAEGFVQEGDAKE